MQTQQYSGPLDVLLSLIQERKLYINELSLAEVTDGYLSYVQSLPALPLAETSQFILVASTLLLIKSRSLLPNLELTPDEEDDIRELTSRLEHYQKIKSAVKSLQKSWVGSHMRFPVKQPVSPIIVFRPGEATAATVFTAGQGLIKALPVYTFKNTEVRVAPVKTLEEVIVSVKDRVLRAARTRFSELSTGAPRHEIILHFLAMLELVKGGSITAEQSGAFDDIMLESQEVGTPSYGV